MENMEDKIKTDDIFIQKNGKDYYVFYVTDSDEDSDEIFGDMHIFADDGVITRINVDIDTYMCDGIPISHGLYRKFSKLIDDAQLEVTALLLRVKREIPKHLKKQSCFVYVRTDGLWAVNQVEYFEAISDDEPGIHRVEVLDEEGGEVHSETFVIGNRTFHLGYSWILRDEVDEDEDFIISKKAYNKIRRIHTKLIADLRELLDANHAEIRSVESK